MANVIVPPENEYFISQNEINVEGKHKSNNGILYFIPRIFKKEIPTEFIPFVGNITKIYSCAFQSSTVNNVVFTKNIKLTVINSNAFSY